MEQIPQRGSVPQIGVFYAPRLCNKSRAMLLVQGLGLKTAVPPLEAIGSALSTQEVAEKPDSHYILIRSAGEVDAARDLPHPDELGAHHALMPAASGAASGVPARRPMCSPREAAGRYGPPSTSESPAHHLRPTGAGGSSAGWGFPSHIPERRQPIPSSLFDKAWNPVLPIS